MKHILTFKMFESQNTYNIGDVVFIKYYLTGDITKVKIINKYSSSSYLVSFNIEDSLFKGSNDQQITSSQIIGKFSGVETPVNNKVMQHTQNPSINVNVGSMIAIHGGDTISNDTNISNDLSL